MIRVGLIEAAAISELGISDAPFALAIVKSVRGEVAELERQYPGFAASLPPFVVTVTRASDTERV